MSKLLNKKTPTVNELAKKYNVSPVEVTKQLMKGIKVEKEHTKSPKIAREIALDHLGEKLDYYTKLAKIEEESAVSGVGGISGLGYVTGSPAGVDDYVQYYVDTNALSYDQQNGSIIKWMKDGHVNLHNKGSKFFTYNPKKIHTHKNFVVEGMSAGPERESDYSIGEPTGGRTSARKLDVQEVRLSPKVRKAVATGMTLANLSTLGQVAGGAAEGKGSPKRDLIAAASTLPGTTGWGATGVHYAKKAYDYVKARKDMKEEKGPCWKGYEMVGMKKKRGKEVPNCVPVEEDWQKVNRQDKTDGLSQKAVNAYRRENPGSKLQTAVTEKNPKGKRAARRKSFCSRMSGMKKRLTSAKTARDPDSRINKALRRWNCEEEMQINEIKASTVGRAVAKAAAERKELTSKKMGKKEIEQWGKRQRLVTKGIEKLTGKSKVSPSMNESNFKEDTTVDTKDLINEAIANIIDNNLVSMKENFMSVLQEKTIEKLEERKKEIAANYFGQD